MIFLFGLFFKIFLTLTTADENGVFTKKTKIFWKKYLPIIGWPRNAQAVHRVDKFFCIYYPTEEKKAVLAVIIEKISLHSPLDTKTRFGRTFFEKIKIFIPLYLSGKNVNPHQCICRCHQKDKNDKVYQGQIPKVLLGKNSIKIHKKKFKNWPWYTLHTAAWVNLDEPLLPKVLLGDFFKNLLRESLYNDLNRG